MIGRDIDNNDFEGLFSRFSESNRQIIEELGREVLFKCYRFVGGKEMTFKHVLVLAKILENYAILVLSEP